MRSKKLLGYIIVTVFATLGGFLLTNRSASAAYDGSNLIDNGTLLNSASMTTGDIQTFLSSKGSGLATRSFPMTCYGSSSREWTLYTQIGAPCGQTVPASQIIYFASQVYGVNPQVVLATLQKEQSLVTSPDPTDWQVNQAMGFNCPTSGSCSDSSNFFYQLDNGAWDLRYLYERAKGNNSWWNTGSYPCDNKTDSAYTYYRPGLFPGVSVTFYDGGGYNSGGTAYRTYQIQNAATAAFYCYTPHAYNNPQGLYGLPAFGSVGSYYSGSYNFVKYFQLWFDPGSTIRDGVTMHIVSQPNLTPALGETVTYVVSYTNNLSTDITVNAVGIVGRAGNLASGANRDFGWQGPIVLAPGVTQTFTFTSITRETGDLYVWPAVNYQGSYVHYNNWGAKLTVHTPNISLTAPLSSTLTSAIAGQTATLSATIKNNEPNAIRLDAIGIPVRLYGTFNYDTAWINTPTTLAPGGTQALSGTVTFDKPGPFTAWVSALSGNQYTTLSPTLSIDTAKAVPNFQLTYTETPDVTPALGEDVAIKFKLKNNSGIPMTLDAVGIVGRYDSPYTGANRDFGWQGPESFTAGEEKTYTTFLSNVSDLKNFYAWIAIRYQGQYIHYNNWGFMMVPHLPNLTLSAPLTINSGTTPTLGQASTVTATIKNNEPHAIRFNALGIPARFYGIYNYDTAWQTNGTLAASGQSGDSIPLSGSITFDKHGPYSVWTSINIQGRYTTISSPVNLSL